MPASDPPAAPDPPAAAPDAADPSADSSAAHPHAGDSAAPEPPTRAELTADARRIAALFLVAGVVVGVLWPQLADPVTVTRSASGVVTDEVALARQFDGEAWYSLLSLGAGLLGGVVALAWRVRDALFTVVVTVVSAMVAALVAAWVGGLLGPPDPGPLLAGAEVGATAPAPWRLDVAAYLLWPIGALIGALVVLWGPGRRWERRG